MTDEFQSKVIGELTTRISMKLDGAAGIARAAHGLGSQGLPNVRSERCSTSSR